MTTRQDPAWKSSSGFRYTDDQRKAAVAAYRERGLQAAVQASGYASPRSILKWVRAAGVPLRQAGQQRLRPWLDPAAARALVETHGTVDGAARAAGVPRTSLLRRLREGA